MVRHRQKRLPDRVRDVIHGKHCSICTEQASVSWIRRFILFHDRRHQKELGTHEIEESLTYPAGERAACLAATNDVPPIWWTVS